MAFSSTLKFATILLWSLAAFLAIEVSFIVFYFENVAGSIFVALLVGALAAHFSVNALAEHARKKRAEEAVFDLKEYDTA